MAHRDERDRRWDDPRTPSADAMRRAALVLVLAALVFAFGWYAGAASSVVPAPVCPPATELACEPCVCPEPAAATTHPPRRPGASPRPPRSTALPPAAVDDEDALSERTLRWVRERAPSLRACLDEDTPRRSFRVALELTGDGRVARADVDPTGGENTDEQRRCLRETIRSWSVPPELAMASPEALIFTLAL